MRMRYEPTTHGTGPLGDRAGFALPAAILALAIVAVLITGGFHMANQEHRVGISSERGTQAFYVAEDGLSRALEAWGTGFAGSTPWAFGDPIQFQGPRGSASVRAMRVGADELYYVESVGRIDEGGALQNGAERAVGMMVRRRVAELSINGALTTQGEVQLRGSSEIHGEDWIPGGWDHCPAAGPTRPGVIVGPGGDVDVRGGNEEERLTGDPPWTVDDEIGDNTFEEFGGLTWDELTSMADIRIPADGSSGETYNIGTTLASLDLEGNCDSWDLVGQTGDILNWGYPYERDDPDALLAPCHTWFPVIHVAGNAQIQSNGYGQGILLVDGDLDLRGDLNYFGVIIVQGQLETQGGANPRIVGGAIARNADLDLQTYVGSSVIQYSSCAVNEAIQNASALSSLTPLARRSWVDLSAGSW
jgi:hypothetical protein